MRFRVDKWHFFVPTKVILVVAPFVITEEAVYIIRFFRSVFWHFLPANHSVNCEEIPCSSWLPALVAIPRESTDYCSGTN